MDITSILTTYGGPGGIIGILAYLFFSDRRQAVERRDELRRDLERKQVDIDRLHAENDKLRAARDAAQSRAAEAEHELWRWRRGEMTNGQA